MAEFEHKLIAENKLINNEAEYFFQTIETMAKSDEDCVDFCSSLSNGEAMESTASIYSWKIVKNNRRRVVRKTNAIRSCNAQNGPPAPPSTPTSMNGWSSMESESGGAPTSGGSSNITTPAALSPAIDNQRLTSLLYILDYAPKYKKKLKEQQRVDAELAELFNVVTITGADNRSLSKLQPERGISSSSRAIRKLGGELTTKIFKIHRNTKEFLRDEENSVSAPEDFDTEEEDFHYYHNQRFSRLRPCKRLLLSTKRSRRFARFEHQERMDSIVNSFGAAMNFNAKEA